MRLFVNSLVAGALALTAVGAAAADPPRGYRDHDRRYEDDRRWDRHDDRRWDRYDDRRWGDDRRWHDHRRWSRGDRFDHRSYVVVRDYRGYRLPPPRRGEYYARTDTGDILLIAAATGLVLWALNN
jgi:Ni/Co efflux regulator RcnB